MISERSLAMAIIDYTRTHKLTTLPSYISALANWFHQHALGDLPRDQLFYRVMKGLKNVFGLTDTTTPKAALTLHHLSIIHAHLDLFSFTDVRDWCSYVLAFFCLLRIHEYISPTLQQQHVKLHTWGVSITIPFSKTNLQPVKIRIVKRDDIFDPVYAVAHYLSMLEPAASSPRFPFFLSAPSRPHPLTDKIFLINLKHRIHHHLHLDSTKYAGHSFRRGGTTALFLARVPETIIAAHGRWKSLAYRKYFDTTINSLLPTQQLLDHDHNQYQHLDIQHHKAQSSFEPMKK
jgi:hypothetical protein